MRGSLFPVTVMNKIFRVERVHARFFLFSLLMLSTVGCLGRVPHPLSTSQMQAIAHIQRGIKSEANGDRQQAQKDFSEALRISRSIENSEGIVVALVNISRAHRHGGDANAALIAISSALPHVTPQVPLYAEVAFEMAQANLLTGKLDKASEWASQAVSTDNSSTRGMMMNLQARILYLKGNVSVAEVTAREALHLNRKNGLREEEANSLRTLGDVQAFGNRSAEATVSYNQALEIDKVCGKSRKIVADLRALASLSLSKDNSEQALDFYARAFAASSTNGDFFGASEDLLNMSRIHERRGEKALSERLLTERGTILKNISTPQ